MDAGRRRGTLRRGLTDAGRRFAHADRPPRRRDEGVGADGAVVVPGQRAPLRRRSVVLQGFRDPSARAIRRRPERRAVGGRHNGVGARVAADRASRARRHRDDRRNLALRTRPARRRHQGKSARRAPSRHHRADPAATEREARQGGSLGGAAQGAHDPLRQRDRRGRRDRAAAPRGTDPRTDARRLRRAAGRVTRAGHVR